MYRGENEWAVACSIAPQNASLAQLAEHVTVNHGVVGSSPSRGAKKGHRPYGLCPFFVTPHGLEPLLFCSAKQEQFAV